MRTEKSFHAWTLSIFTSQNEKYHSCTVNTFVSKSGHLRFFQKLPNIIFGTFSHFY